MGRYFAPQPLTRELGDIACRRHPHGRGWYTVYVGDFLIGTVASQSGGSWSAISGASPELLRGFRSCEGFRRRWDAIEFLLRACGSRQEVVVDAAVQSAPVGYTVSFEYTIEEVSGPIEAAIQAYDLLTDPQSMRPVAAVTGPDGKREEIDLQAEEF